MIPMRTTIPFLVLAFVLLTGCSDRPEVSSQTYGTVLRELPIPKAAEEPFSFPFAGEDDHRNCVFKEDDFF